MDLANARRAFLSTFPAQYRDHIIAFARQMSRLDVDVLMLTARKAVCLFHCLEYLGLFSPGKKLRISERWMDHDQSWLAGKRVAIVDEVIVTGTSIYKLHRDLLDARAASVEVHCLFINGTYFVEDFFRNINLSQGFIKLDGQEAQALSTNGTYFGLSAIVDAGEPLMAKSEVTGLGSIGWLVTKHPNQLSEGQPAWIVKREAICINAAAVSRGARDRPKRWSSSTC